MVNLLGLDTPATRLEAASYSLRHVSVRDDSCDETSHESSHETSPTTYTTVTVILLFVEF